MGRRVLIDNDALLKLAQYGLLEAALHALDCAPSDVRVLPTVRYSLMPQKDKLRRCKDEETADRLEAFLASVGQLDATSSDAAMLDELIALPGVDAGEAQLFAVAAADTEVFILTGDKRALAALCSAPTVAKAVTALSGRIIAVETVFAMLADGDFSATQARVRAKPKVDKALTNIFGVSAPASRGSVLEGLHSYTANLRAATGPLLFWYVSS